MPPDDFGLPIDRLRHALRCAMLTAHCDLDTFARAFSPFGTSIAGFLRAARQNERFYTATATATATGATIRFALTDGAALLDTVRPGAWYLLKDLTALSPSVSGAYADLCAGLGIDTLGEVSAYTHGAALHAPRHTDLTGGLIVVLEGKREWRIEPPDHVGDGIFDVLRSRPWGGGFGRNSVFVATGPGDMLYIPGGWWHETRSLTPSLAIRIGLAERTRPPTRP